MELLCLFCLWADRSNSISEETLATVVKFITFCTAGRNIHYTLNVKNSFYKGDILRV